MKTAKTKTKKFKQSKEMSQKREISMKKPRNK